MKANRGIALPVVIVLTALLGVVVMTELPSGPALSIKNLRYKHLTWWHWQQAVTQFFHKNGQWPDSLTDVRTEFGLATEPSFIQGYSIPGGFRVRINGITIAEEKSMALGLQPYVQKNVPNSLDADLNPFNTDTSISPFLIARHVATDMEVALNMNGYNLNQTDFMEVNNQLSLTRAMQAGIIETQTLQSTELNHALTLTVANLHTHTQSNIIEELTTNIKAMYGQLDNFMKTR